MNDKLEIVVSTVYSKKRALDAVTQHCMSDKIMMVTIEPYQHEKTHQQRKGWHWLLNIMAKETGYTLLEMKNIVKVMILYWLLTKILDA